MSESKEILEMNRDEFNKLNKNVVRKAVFKKPGRHPVDKPALASDRIICGVCGKEFTRSGRTCHNKTVYHKERMKINKKLNELLL